MNEPNDWFEKLERFTWHLARAHGWGGEVEFEKALDGAFSDSEKGEARELLRQPIKSYRVKFFQWSESDGEKIRMRGDRRVLVAYYLRDEAGYSELRIEATVSRFKDIDGGFESTEKPEMNFIEPP